MNSVRDSGTQIHVPVLSTEVLTNLKIVANGVNAMKSKDRSTIVVTHYQRLLNYIVPDFVHVIVDGMIVKSGDKTLALELEEKGYEEVIKESKN